MLKILLDRTAAPRLWLIALTLWMAVTIISAIALWHLHRSALEGQSREIGLLSLTLADEVDRGLRGVEEGLSALRLELDYQHFPLADHEAVRTLRIHAKLMPLVQTIWLLENSSQLLGASDDSPLPDLLSFSPALTRLNDETSAFSQPFGSPNASEPLVVLAIRFGNRKDASGGWILAGMPASTLLGAFSAASPGTDIQLAVLRADGARLVGSLDASVPRDEATLAPRPTDLSGMEVRKQADGSERLFARRSLPRYGLQMILTQDLRGVLKPWRETTQMAIVGLLLLLVTLITFARQIVRADQRNAEAQQALQTQLSRASKLEALGALAGGVAHDFNNVLAAILGFGEMAQDAAPKGSHQARHLDKVLQAALRGKTLAERILSFGRSGAHKISVFELEPLVEEVLALLVASLRPGIVLQRQLEVRRARLRGDQTQAFEAIMNLCTNAMQAMNEKGGTLTVQLKRVRVVSPRVLSHSLLSAGNYLSLSVSDQGTGINPEVMDRLFEPFFTTRTAQAGTGLGLAVVHGIVAEFGGAIDVQSTPGVGACFTLYFPECEASPGAQKPLQTTTPKGEGQWLMVVDDDALLVAMAEEMLKGLGYDPVGYSDPISALQALRENPGQFAAVITDEVMPGLRGTQLTAALRSVAPDLPVLLISGYGGTQLASRATTAGVTRVLTKPLQRAELARALEELLR